MNIRILFFSPGFLQLDSNKILFRATKSNGNLKSVVDKIRILKSEGNMSPQSPVEIVPLLNSYRYQMLKQGKVKKWQVSYKKWQRSKFYLSVNQFYPTIWWVLEFCYLDSRPSKTYVTAVRRNSTFILIQMKSWFHKQQNTQLQVQLQHNTGKNQ